MKKIISIIISALMIAATCIAPFAAYADSATNIEVNKTYVFEDNSSEARHLKFAIPRTGYMYFVFKLNNKVDPEPSGDDQIVYIGNKNTVSFSATVKKPDGTEVYKYSYYYNPLTATLGGTTKINTPCYILAGTYLLDVNYSYANYDFIAKYYDSNEDFVESYFLNNNALADADTAAFNKEINGTLAIDDSEDYYRIDIPKKSEVKVNFKSQSGMVRHEYSVNPNFNNNYSFAEMNFELLNAAGMSVSPSDTLNTSTADPDNNTSFAKVSNQERENTYLLNQGTYYLKVSNWEIALDPAYKFSVSKSCLTHDYKTLSSTTATCTTNGNTLYECVDCGKQYSTTQKATGHNTVTDKAIAPTFSKAGKTQGSHCSKCGKVLVAQKPVAKLGSPKLSKVTAGKKSFKAAWNTVKSIDGYQIQYSTNASFKSSNKTVTVKGNKATAKTVSGLKAKKKYYVRIRAYKTINGKKQYSSWSSKKAVTTKK